MSAAPRLTSTVLVGAIRRLAEGQGGFATVITKGDETSGTVVLQVLEKGSFAGLFERMPVSLDESEWRRLDTEEPEIENYIARRCRTDPDLWLMELNVPEAPRLIAALATTA